MVAKKLNAKQERFVDEYLVDLNATQAALRAGYSAKTANAQGSRLLIHEGVQAAIQAAREGRQKRTAITAEYVLRQAVELHERCMQQVKPVLRKGGVQATDEEGNAMFTFDSAGAARALEIVGKHVDIQAFRERLEMSGPGGAPIQTEAVIDVTKLSEEELAALAVVATAAERDKG